MNEILVEARKLRARKKREKFFKIFLLVLLIVIILLYIVSRFVNSGYDFMITLDKNLYLKNNVIIYDDPNYKVYRSRLEVPAMEFIDEISYKWLPNGLDSVDGSHNGDNYIAYTFYIENMGDDVVDYWSEFIVDDVIRNLDEAIRVMIIKDGVSVTYAKKSLLTGNAEDGTKMFYDDSTINVEHVVNFKPGDISKYTIVIWLEGNDIDCTNNILGGEFSAHLEFKSEYRESQNKK